jgi:hypothetical protein
MVKVLHASRNADGLPHVRWEQQVPTGESVYAAGKRIELKIAAVVMIFIFAWAYASGWHIGVSVFAALMVGGLVLGGGQVAFKEGINLAGVHVPGPRGPSEATLEQERRDRATAIMETERREVMIAPARHDPKQLFMFVHRGKPEGELETVAVVPLSSLQPFELGTAEEWYGDIAQRQRDQSLPNSYVIVNPTLGHGVIAVAESGGSRAGIANLHGVLTREIATRIGEMEQRWKERVEEDEEAERKRRGGSGAP